MTLTVLALVGHPAVGQALPPPPPNPSDDDLKSSQGHVDATATRVGQLANQVAQADADLVASQSQVELRHEQANKALINLQAADNAAAAANLAADSARAEADAAVAQIAAAHQDLDQLRPRVFVRATPSDHCRPSSARPVRRTCSPGPSCWM